MLGPNLTLFEKSCSKCVIFFKVGCYIARIKTAFDMKIHVTYEFSYQVYIFFITFINIDNV